MTDLPPLQESRPRDYQTRRGKEYGNLIWGSLHVLILLLLPFGAPWNLEVLDGVALCMTSCLIQIAIGVSRVGHIGLEVDGSVIDVLVEIGLVRKSKTLPELCHVETLRTMGNTGGTPSGNCLFFVLWRSRRGLLDLGVISKRADESWCNLPCLRNVRCL